MKVQIRIRPMAIVNGRKDKGSSKRRGSGFLTRAQVKELEVLETGKQGDERKQELQN